ncbi:DUF1697 domain-containing protein [Acetoanaerobium sticklandii]|uniref:DUF1697 domain-containing protein n=1 Tax=Acetoanaerobium sticklandii TaxID=1511 RepID=UPI003A8F469B
MVYVALLRGINVGGNNKVEMSKLKETFNKLGMKEAKTYINSGNVIFNDSANSKQELENTIKKAIFQDFEIDIKVLVRDVGYFEKLLKVLPNSWRNDSEMKCDVLFLTDDLYENMLKEKIKINPQVDNIIYTRGAVIWAVDKKDVTKSHLVKLVGTDIYKNMTVRNVNTVRKIYGIMKINKDLEIQ